jgi:hypothetical protein
VYTYKHEVYRRTFFHKAYEVPYRVTGIPNVSLNSVFVQMFSKYELLLETSVSIS